ncbi:homing endonuclease associated repeat-containing protein [Haladaptatus sp. DFWS20]|uniref:homing endonuclease associated repeat-containing protein n=1 Tax=Haladaptatus sp. DFWS20 TaxID=3403467 RepID=UPI003EBC1DE9
MASKLSAEQLISDLQTFAEKLGEVPKQTAMNDRGPHSSTLYYNQFGSWNDALRAAGFSTNHENGISEDELVLALQELAEELGRPPKFEEMNGHGEYSAFPYFRQFGSWPEAKEAAGLDPKTTTSRRISREELIDALSELEQELGETPSQKDMCEHGQYSHRPFYREFDLWNEALKAAGFETNHENEIAKEKLLQEMQRMVEKFGRAPTMQEMRDEGRYSPRPYLHAFDSWVGAWNVSGLKYHATRPNNQIDSGELFAALREIADELDKIPSKIEMERYGAYSAEPFKREFGSWNDGLEAAGFSPSMEHDISK